MTIENKQNLTFEINNSKAFFNKLLEEYTDFDKQHLNPRHAMNCAITSWHLTDWTYHEYYITDPSFQEIETTDKKGNNWIKSGLSVYQDYMIKLCPELKYMKLITNGVKHCVLNDKNLKEKTVLYQGDFSSDFSRHDFDVTRFVIIDKRRSIDFENVLKTTIEFWRNFITKNK